MCLLNPGASPVSRRSEERRVGKDPREDRVMDVRECVPGEKHGKEKQIAAAAAVEPAEEKEKKERQEGPPLILDVRDLREAPGHEGKDHPGEERSGGVARDLAGERPRRHGGEKHAEQEEEVVD